MTDSVKKRKTYEDFGQFGISFVITRWLFLG